MPTLSATVPLTTHSATPSATAVMAEPLGDNPHVASTTATPRVTYQASAVAHLQPTATMPAPPSNPTPLLIAVAAGSVVGLVGILIHRLVESPKKSV